MNGIFGGIRDAYGTIAGAVSLSAVLLAYLAARGCDRLSRAGFIPSFAARPLAAVLPAVYARFSGRRRAKSGSISRLDLIDVSLRNMSARKTRTRVTVGGMMIGIGAIVFLVSVGFGLQHLVIERVARLEELRQFDVFPPSGGTLRIDDGTLADISALSGVASARPMISAVGHVTYNDSVSDMAVYGVTTDYLRESAIRPSEGELFESDTIVPASFPSGERGGFSESSTPAPGAKIGDVVFSGASSWIRVREAPDADSALLGYTRISGTPEHGEEYWGAPYDGSDAGRAAQTAEDKTELGRWVRADVPLWETKACNSGTQGDCEDGTYMVLRDRQGAQTRVSGYFAEIGIETSPASENDTFAVLVEEDGSGMVRIGESPSDTSSARTVSVDASGDREAVLSRAAIRLLGIGEREAVGKTFSVSFVVVSDLLSDTETGVESLPVEYEIVGVLPEESAPLFYVPFTDLRSLGVARYSQVKVAVTDQGGLSDARRRVEALGYGTRSVADTVTQIDVLFGTARTVLALVGMIALSIAALGMFNTLTVSLLERTREVGLMKAMGMKSREIRDLFLAESMIMGMFGGVLGLALGYGAGKMLGLVLSSLTLFRGVGYMDVSLVPLPFALLILVLSALVGFTTGIYPARRATKISALDALRYE